VWWKQAGLVGGGLMLLYIDTFVDVDVENGYTCKYEMEERYGRGVLASIDPCTLSAHKNKFIYSAYTKQIYI